MRACGVCKPWWEVCIISVPAKERYVLIHTSALAPLSCLSTDMDKKLSITWCLKIFWRVKKSRYVELCPKCDSCFVVLPCSVWCMHVQKKREMRFHALLGLTYFSLLSVPGICRISHRFLYGAYHHWLMAGNYTIQCFYRFSSISMRVPLSHRWLTVYIEANSAFIHLGGILGG